MAICDTPGFGDSDGVEVDIANNIGVIRAIRGASSVRVIVILPYHSLIGDRMDGLIKMSETISNLFSDTEVYNSIKIYFNKFPKNQIK